MKFSDLSETPRRIDLTNWGVIANKYGGRGRKKSNDMAELGKLLEEQGIGVMK